jgi:hypothetical protein
VQITAKQGKKITGGTWSRPDLIAVSVMNYKNLPGKFLEVISFEVKTAENCDVTAVYEALSHLRSTTQAYVLVRAPQQKSESVRELLSDVADEAGRHGIGLIIAEDVADYGSWEFKLEATTRQPPGDRLDEFLETQINEENRKKLAKWIK